MSQKKTDPFIGPLNSSTGEMKQFLMKSLSEKEIYITGGAALGAALVVKKLFRKEVLPVGSVQRMVESFVFVTLSALIGNEISIYLEKKK